LDDAHSLPERLGNVGILDSDLNVLEVERSLLATSERKKTQYALIWGMIALAKPSDEASD
jgi:hypothetical protein